MYTFKDFNCTYQNVDLQKPEHLQLPAMPGVKVTKEKLHQNDETIFVPTQRLL